MIAEKEGLLRLWNILYGEKNTNAMAIFNREFSPEPTQPHSFKQNVRKIFIKLARALEILQRKEIKI